jgi:hypothetical protein
MRLDMNVFPVNRLQRELQGKDRRRVLRPQAALQITGGAMKIVIRLREVLLGRVTVLRDCRRSRRRAMQRNRMMMRGYYKQHMQNQAKQDRSDNSLPVLL